MVLVSFLLVLAAAVTLVIGLLNSGLGLIYVSIGQIDDRAHSVF